MPLTADPSADTAAWPDDWAPAVWAPAGAGEILRRPLPGLGLADRWLLRAVALAASNRVSAITGLEHVRPAADPFVLVLNHSTRSEALLVPALLTLLRGGPLIHFMADWNFALIPGVGLLYRKAEVLAVTAKPARPRVLDRLRPLYRADTSVLDRARDALRCGRSVGIFPEATVNRDPHRLRPGRRSAALLSLTTGVPVVPAGIRFPDASPDRPIRDRDRMELRIGPPLRPPPPSERPAPADLRAWHATVMTAVAALSGKSWSDTAPAAAAAPTAGSAPPTSTEARHATG
jgi:1-acyl-sn-glycerol-3-phosphate acyltransferase